jgi:hypothetical protein
MILTHFLYDFHWQGDFIGKYKSKYPFILFVHSITYAMIVGLPYILLYKNYFPLLIFLISHFIIDGEKSIAIKRHGEIFWFLYVDQFLHFLMILGVWLLYTIK